MAVGYNPRIVTDGLVLALDAANAKSYDSSVFGQQTYTSSGTYSWTCPSGVTSVSVVCIGGGGGGNGGGYAVGGAGGGGGGGLGYKNNIPVTPGQSYTVVVGGGGAGDYWNGPPYDTNPANSGGDSYFIDATTVKGGGGGGGNGNSAAAGGSGGTYVGDGGGNGYSGGTGSSGGGTGYMPATGGGGGSTGTYTGSSFSRGSSKFISSNCTSGCLAGSGTGQGLLGTGSSGSYGRGGGANMNTFSNGTSGYTGAVRIMWGPGRSYPSTGVADQSSSTTFSDISDKGNNGTLINGPTYSSANSGVFVFDGTNHYAQSGTSSDLIIGTQDYTMSLWVKYDSAKSEIALMDNRSAHGNGTTFSLIQVGDYMRVKVWEDNTSSFSFESSTNLSANTWYNITYTRISNSASMYINGVQDGSSWTQTYNYSGGNKITLGWNYSTQTGKSINGMIAYVLFYVSKGLTSTEVKQNFNTLRGRFGI